MSEAAEEEVAPNSGGSSGSAAPFGRTPEGRLKSWHRSPEFSATRKIGTLLGIIVIALAALILWPAFNERYAALQAYDHARGIAANALGKFTAAQNAEENAQMRVRETEAMLAAETRSLDTSADRREQLARRLERAQAEVADAAGQRRTMDAKREATWQDEIAAGRAADRSTNSLLLRTGFGVALTLAVALLFWYVRDEKRRAFENRQILSDIGEKAVRTDDSLPLRALWHDNREQLQLYHKLVLNYASSTRQTTLATLVVGFAFLVAVGAFSLFANNVASAVVISVVSAAGAAVAGFIAQAVLKNSETSSREVLAFFSHPLEVERILAAERVIESMPESERDTARLMIIQALTRAPEALPEGPRRSVAEPDVEARRERSEEG